MARRRTCTVTGYVTLEQYNLITRVTERRKLPRAALVACASLWLAERLDALDAGRAVELQLPELPGPLPMPNGRGRFGRPESKKRRRSVAEALRRLGDLPRERPPASVSTRGADDLLSHNSIPPEPTKPGTVGR